MKLNFCDIGRQYTHLKDKIDERMGRVLSHGKFINGPEVGELEKKCADFVGTKEAIAVSSGTDALTLSVQALGIGSEDYVITTPFTFAATVESIAIAGANPVFVDIDPRTYNLCPKRLDDFLKTTSLPKDKIKAVLAVDLFGQTADYGKIQQVTKAYGLHLIEDGAQSLGAEHHGRKACSFGEVATTSFFPAKPFGCFGDGGMVFTSNSKLAENIRMLRNHGQRERYIHHIIGTNARLDTLQAAILLAKLGPFVEEELGKRRRVASIYHKHLKPLEKEGKVYLPFIESFNNSTFAQYSMLVWGRDGLRQQLAEEGIPTAVHYPQPVYLQPAFARNGYEKGSCKVAEDVASRIISLPMDAYKTEKEIKLVTDTIKKFQ